MPNNQIAARFRILDGNSISGPIPAELELTVALNSENQAGNCWDGVIRRRNGASWTEAEHCDVDLVIEQMAFASYVRTFRPALFVFLGDRLVGELEIAGKSI